MGSVETPATIIALLSAVVFSLPGVCIASDLPTEPTATQAEDDRDKRIIFPNEERQMAGWTVVSAGSLFVLLGLASSFQIDKLETEIDNEAGQDDSSTQEIKALIDKQDIFEGLQLVGLIGGATLVVGGVTLLYMDAQKTAPKTISLIPWLSPLSAGMVLETNF